MMVLIRDSTDSNPRFYDLMLTRNHKRIRGEGWGGLKSEESRIMMVHDVSNTQRLCMSIFSNWSPVTHIV